MSDLEALVVMDRELEKVLDKSHDLTIGKDGNEYYVRDSVTDQTVFGVSPMEALIKYAKDLIKT